MASNLCFGSNSCRTAYDIAVFNPEGKSDNISACRGNYNVRIVVIEHTVPVRRSAKFGTVNALDSEYAACYPSIVIACIVRIYKARYVRKSIFRGVNVFGFGCFEFRGYTFFNSEVDFFVARFVKERTYNVIT